MVGGTETLGWSEAEGPVFSVIIYKAELWLKTGRESMCLQLRQARGEGQALEAELRRDCQTGYALNQETRVV